jgi:hypothetical protein
LGAGVLVGPLGLGVVAPSDGPRFLAELGLILLMFMVGLDLDETDIPEEVKAKAALGVHWTGYLNPGETGDYLLGIQADGFARVSLGDQYVVEVFSGGTDLGPGSSGEGAGAAPECRVSTNIRPQT